MKYLQYRWTDGTRTYLLNVRETNSGYEGEYEGTAGPNVTTDNGMSSGNTIDEVLENAAQELFSDYNKRVIWTPVNGE